MQKEASARIKINKLLEQAGWRFEADKNGPANIQLEPGVILSELGDDFEHVSKGYIDFLLLDKDGRALVVVEAKKESVDPLSVDSYQNIINGAKQIIKNWKPVIDIDPKWPRVQLEEVCLINPKKNEVKNLNSETEVSFVPMSDLSQKEPYFKVLQTKKLSEVMGSYTYFAENDVLLARVTPCFENGKAGIARNLKNKIGFGSSEYTVLRPTEKILPEIIYAYVTADSFNNNGRTKMTGTGGLQRVPVNFVQNWEISLPSLKIQKQIVERIESERIFVEGNKKLIEIYVQKTKNTLAKLWEE